MIKDRTLEFEKRRAELGNSNDINHSKNNDYIVNMNELGTQKALEEFLEKVSPLYSKIKVMH